MYSSGWRWAAVPEEAAAARGRRVRPHAGACADPGVCGRGDRRGGRTCGRVDRVSRDDRGENLGVGRHRGIGTVAVTVTAVAAGPVPARVRRVSSRPAACRLNARCGRGDHRARQCPRVPRVVRAGAHHLSRCPSPRRSPTRPPPRWCPPRRAWRAVRSLRPPCGTARPRTRGSCPPGSLRAL